MAGIVYVRLDCYSFSMHLQSCAIMKRRYIEDMTWPRVDTNFIYHVYSRAAM